MIRGLLMILEAILRISICLPLLFVGVTCLWILTKIDEGDQFKNQSGDSPAVGGNKGRGKKRHLDDDLVFTCSRIRNDSPINL